MLLRAIFYIIAILIITACNKPQSKLISVKELSDYPSASGLAYHDGRIYIMGDDAAYMLIMDTSFNIIDSISVFDAAAKRIAKDRKADPEAIALINKKPGTELLVIGSGSLSPYRDSCYNINLPGKTIKRTGLDTFYQALKNVGLEQLNIEGAVIVGNNIVLSNRGNKSFPKNHLIIAPALFWQNQAAANIKLIKAGTNPDTSTFAGVSGLDYSYLYDQLILSVSEENTYNNYDDGAIGKSYLWIINNFSSKRRMSAVNPNTIIDLEETDQRFKGHKIESVCIVSENKDEKQLILAADDDKGGSLLFKLQLIREK